MSCNVISNIIVVIAVIPLIKIQQDVVQNCTSKNDIIDFVLVLYQHVILQYVPSLLEYTKSTLYIFPHRLESLTESQLILLGGMLVRTLHYSPLVVTSIT